MSYAPHARQRARWSRAATRAVPLFGIGCAPLGDTMSSIAGFPAAVERWRPLLERYAAGTGIPVNFLLAWIQRESGGNPCSWTTLRESGVFQLMYPDNLVTAGVTEPELRAACVPNTSQAARPLTAAEADVQVRSGIQYVRAMVAEARQKLAAAGVAWPETSSSFWAFVKLQHAYPGPSLGWLTASKAILGRPPASFAELRSTISGYASVLDNAAWVGAYGEGGAGSPLGALLLAGGAVLLYYLWERRS